MVCHLGEEFEMFLNNLKCSLSSTTRKYFENVIKNSDELVPPQSLRRLLIEQNLRIALEKLAIELKI